MKKILRILQKRNIKTYEIFYQKRNSYDISFEQNELNSLQYKDISGIGLRLFIDGKQGFSYTNDLKNLEELVDNATESAKFGKKIKYELPGENGKHPELDIFEDAYWDEKAWINKGKEILKEIKSKSKEVKIDLSFTKSLDDVELVNSHGLEKKYRKSAYRFVISGLAILQSGFTWVFDIKSSTHPFEDIDNEVQSILETLEKAGQTSSIKTGKYPVIFSPKALFTIVRAISLGINGKYVQKGISPLKDKLGKPILSDKLSIIDNPFNNTLTGAKPFDGEGIPTKILPIIENGTLVNFVHTIETASARNVSPTGNAQRDYESLPTPGANNFSIKHGEKKLDDMVFDIDRGLYIEDVIGGGQSNILAGDYSVNVGLGFLIEDGEIAGRVKNTMISGNIYEDFKHIIDISQENKSMENLDLPYISCDGISVTAG